MKIYNQPAKFAYLSIFWNNFSRIAYRLRMWIPTHYVVLFVAILLLESAALFIYTLIGLLKQNPLPWVMPPPQPDFSMCRDGRQGNGIARGGPQSENSNGELALMNPAEVSVQVITSTSILTQTSIMPVGPPSGSPLLEGIPIPGTANTLGSVAVISTSGAPSITTVTSSQAAQSISTSGAPSITTVTASQAAQSISSSSPSSATVQASSSAVSTPTTTVTEGDSAKASSANSSGGQSPTSVQAPAANLGSLLSLAAASASRSEPATAPSQPSNVVTREATLTSIIPASQPPRPTSTTVVVVPASPARN